MITERPEYRIWASIKQRCFPPKHKFSYEEKLPMETRWKHSFEDFLKDVGNKPKGRYYLIRKDKKKGYVKGNMEWSTKTPKPQPKYKIYLTYKQQTKPLVIWCREYGINYRTAINRMKSGWEPEDILTITPKANNKKLRKYEKEDNFHFSYKEILDK